jgi:hypothetical protein
MSYRNKTYVAFDGDNDMYYYRTMQMWKENEHIDFNFYDAHDINSARDTSEVESIKAQLRERMANAKQMVLLVGKKTKYQPIYIPWEIELARKKDIPIIVANINEKRIYDADLCPPAVVKDKIYTIHLSFNAKIIKYALDEFPDAYDTYKNVREGNWYYKDSVYKELGL